MKRDYRLSSKLIWFAAVVAIPILSPATYLTAQAAKGTTQKSQPNLYPYLDGVDNIKVNQYLLRAHGYKIAVDGHYGPQTKGAIAKFQRKRDLAASGVVDDATWKALTIVSVKMGSRGDAVRAVQYALSYGDVTYKVAIDGVFGPQTKAAVIKFQKYWEVGTKGDGKGVVGAGTWRKLLESTTQAYP